MAVQVWIDGYNTENTRDAAHTSYNAFLNYLDNCNVTLEEWIESVKQTEDEKYVKLNLFCKSLNLMPASVRKYYSFIKSYLRVIHGIKIDIEDQKQFIKFAPVQKISREPITKEVIKSLCMSSSQEYRSLLLVLSSSGMRVSECIALKKENYDFSTDPIMVTIPAYLTKTKSERITFISKEAKSNIDKCDYFKERTLNSVEWYFWKLRKTLGYVEKYENSINYKLNLHAFRAFFRTQSGKINQDFGEAILGHEGYLRQYVRLEDKEKSDYYKKLEPKIKIF